MPGRPPPVNVQANRGFEVSRANLRDATIVFDLDGTLVDTAPAPPKTSTRCWPRFWCTTRRTLPPRAVPSPARLLRSRCWPRRGKALGVREQARISLAQAARGAWPSILLSQRCGPQHVRRVEAGPGHVTHVIAFAGGEPSHTIMVGGSDVDIGTAKRAHVPSILVSFGYAPEALHELVPDATIDHFDQLVP